jgi:IS30 family transposase
MEEKKITRLTLNERIKIEILIKEKRSKSYIAKALHRSRSTIGSEINRWVGTSQFYNAELAHFYARVINNSKRNKDKMTLFPRLKLQVYRGLLSGLSPEAISGSLKVVYPEEESMQISYESIYRHIYEHPQGGVNKKLIKLLTRKKTRRQKSKKRIGHKEKISKGISIENRPVHINSREEAGHWEGDLIIGVKQNSSIGSIVERKSRYTLLVKIDDRKSKTVCEAFSKKFNKEPVQLRKTMTYDNGSEMAEHKYLSENTGINIYFAHPYSSWERGTNENTNGIIRRFYPKKTTDFNKISNDQLMELQQRLNNRPRKVLGYYTPNEVYQIEKNKFNRNDNDVVLKMGNKSHKDLFSFLIPQLE